MAKKNSTTAPAKKAAPAKSQKPVTAKLEKIVGHDQKNGTVTLVAEGKGYRVTNDRTGYNEFVATRTVAVEEYNSQINNSHRQ